MIASTNDSRRARVFAVALGFLGLLVCAFGAGSARATYGEGFGLAAAQGVMPAGPAFWAGACDLSSSKTVAGQAPAHPLGCIDSGTINKAPSEAAAWSVPPAWMLSPVTQAGAHPDATATFMVARDTANQSGLANFVPFPAGSIRDVAVPLPAGLAGNPRAVPKCSNDDFETSPPSCQPSTQVGAAELTLNFAGAQLISYLLPVYNLEPLKGSTAEFGIPNVAAVSSIRIVAKLRSESDFGITAGVERIPTGLSLMQQSLTLWGVPWAASHDRFRFPANYVPLKAEAPPVTGLPAEAQAHYESSWGPIQPFISNATTCDGSRPTTGLAIDSWQRPGRTLADGEPDLGDPAWVSAESAAPPMTGCEKVQFHPDLTVGVDQRTADTPAAFDFDVSTPQNNEAPMGVSHRPDAEGAPAYWRGDAGLATSYLRNSTVTLPAGVHVNAASGAGLAACTESQIGLTSESPIRFDNAEPTCPDGSKIGTVEVETPLLEKNLDGTVYLAAQDANPFHSLVALYLVVKDEERDLTVKLAGKSTMDPATGQITATFADNPQVPFEHLRLHLMGGPRAPLATPASCGTYTTESRLDPWSGNPPAAIGSSFSIDQGPGGGACPSGALDLGFSSGLVNPVAGATSPFLTRVVRPDGSGRIDGLDLTLPVGLTAYLKGVPYCSEAALGAAAANRGRSEQANPSCPAASQVGTVTVGAGVGPTPLFVHGKIYLAGPYKGAPLSLAIVTPAVAGPFDLGTVVVRSALRVDPLTAQVSAVSDPIPTILQGIPLDVREIRVNVDRPNFTVAPTSCTPQSVLGSVTGAGGLSASLSDRFQVGSCGALDFTPKLALSVKGGARRGAYQKLKAVLTATPGQANIEGVSVNLPHSEFLAQEHIKTICTRVQFAADQCPAGSVYGKAKAWTPLLDQPLEGPVYLRSSSHRLPDLVVALHGQIDIDLAGRIDSKNGGIRTTFEGVPDAPVSRFVLEMNGGKKSLLVNSENLCSPKANRVAVVRSVGQNGKVQTLKPKLAVRCSKAKKPAGKGGKKG